MTAYFDHAATTPVRPEVAEAMLPWLTTRYGNPSGGHAVARAARAVLEEAREEVAEHLGRAPREVVFTSGGTEADNLAVHGVAAGRVGGLACSAVEHHAVLDAVLARGGTTFPVAADGRVDLDRLAAAVDGSTGFVSVLLVNGETGVISPLSEVVEMVRAHAPSALIHTDAVQAVPWLEVAGAASGADLVSISAHKFGGPQGVGALVVREGVVLEPLLRGGGQERGRRSGTHAVVAAVGMAAALRACATTRVETLARVGALRDRLADGLLTAVPGAVESGVRATKVAGSCHLLLDGVASEALLVLLDRAGVCASAASSCASGALHPSHVLEAMGVPPGLAAGSLRLSLGWSSTDADVDAALAVVPAAVAALRRKAA